MAQEFSDEVDHALARYSRGRRSGKSAMGLKFVVSLERAFTTDTAESRRREIRLTLSIGFLFYMATALTDPGLVPDLGWHGIELRLLAAPLFALTAFSPKHLGGAAREYLLSSTICLALAFLIVISAVSRSSLAPFSYATVAWALIYVNTTIPLRFAHACMASVIVCAGLLTAIAVNRTLSGGLAFSLALQTLVACAFSMIANYRIERSLRLNYLLTAEDRHRLTTLTAERESFAALSKTDRLTGLGNRLQLELRWADLFDSSPTAGRPVGLLMIDVDYFKRYNDFYGHVAGDACLRALADVFAASLPGGEALAVRFGGEEFVVLLPGMDAKRSHVMAQRIRDAIAERRLPHANREDVLGFVTVSVGVAHTVVGHGASIDGLLAKADDALYEAKRLGRNRVETRHLIAA